MYCYQYLIFQELELQVWLDPGVQMVASGFVWFFLVLVASSPGKLCPSGCKDGFQKSRLVWSYELPLIKKNHTWVPQTHQLGILSAANNNT